MQRKKATNTETIEVKHEKAANIIQRHLDTVLITFSAFFLPSIFLYHLYLGNRIENDIPFNIIVVAALFFGIISIVLFMIFSFASRSKEAGLIVLIIFWALFWTFGHTYEMANNFTIASSTRHTVGLAILICLIILFFRRYSFSFNKIRAVFRILPVTVIIFFLLNFIPSYNVNRIDYISIDTVNSSGLFRTNFEVDNSLPTPDIYWIQPDAMIGLETLGRFFDEPLSEFQDALEQRGFQIYSNARMYTGVTRFSIPALLSPNFHDETWYEIYSKLKFVTGSDRPNVMQQVRRAYNEMVPNANHEMLVALRKRGYEINFMHVPAGSYWVEARPDRIFVRLTGNLMTNAHMDDGLPGLFAESGDFPQLLSIATPLVFLNEFVNVRFRGYVVSDVPELSDEVVYTLNQDIWHDTMLYRDFIRLLSATATLPQPRLVFAASYITHGNWWGPRMTDVPWHDYSAIDQIVPSHELTSHLLLNAVDLIIANNPDAVIVIQSDHGIHSATGGLQHWYYLKQYDFTDEEIFELRHSVFNAVRIPLRYGGLDAPLAPLNISRELVNRFVGQNYTLLP